MYAPGSITTDETFIWYRANDRLRLGIAHLLKQNAIRYLAAYTLAPETSRSPSVNLSAGVQGIGTGNPGYSATLEKNFILDGGKSSINLFAGVGFRSNENIAREVAGLKFTTNDGFSIGIQDDGKLRNPFATYATGNFVAGIYLVGGEHPAFLFGMRF